MKFFFSIAEQSNVPELNSLINSVYRGETGLRAWTGEAHLIDGQRTDVEALRDSISLSDSVIIIARADETGSRPIGCVHLKKQGDHAYLGMLTADVSFQRSGLGSALLNEAERFTSENFGLDEIRMTVISLRTELIDWYVRRGYRVTGERAPFPYGNPRFGLPKRDDLEFVVLNKKL